MLNGLIVLAVAVAVIGCAVVFAIEDDHRTGHRPVRSTPAAVSDPGVDEAWTRVVLAGSGGSRTAHRHRPALRLIVSDGPRERVR